MKCPQNGFEYHMISFDKDGTERGNDSQDVLSTLSAQPITDLFVMSHGWKGDVPGAELQYNSWFNALHTSASARRDGQTLLVGVHWPSLPFGDETLPVSFAATPPKDFLAAFADDLEALRLAGEVMEEARHSANEITPKARDALVQLARHLGLEDNPAGSPGQDGPALTASAFETSADDQDDVSFGGGLVSGPMNMLVQLSFWEMKKRARTVGEAGVHRFLKQMLETNGTTRVHLMGHSLGSIVVSSAVGGPNASGSLPRPIHSLALVQGAVSLWAYSPKIELANNQPGYFSRLLRGQNIAGPVITTQSTEDTAVGRYYVWGANIDRSVSFAPAKLPRFGGVGTYGIQGRGAAQEFTVSGSTMLPSGKVYEMKPGRVYNLNGSEFIPEHNAISGPEVAQALWSAARS